MNTSFMQRLDAAQVANQSLLCVGLDPVPSRFPKSLKHAASSIRRFNRAIIDATADIACCYKPNLGFYLPNGQDGLDALLALRDDVPAHIPLLLDAKIGDIASTSAAYAEAYFDNWEFDAVTAHPYMGHDSLEPLLKYEDRGVFILAKTSNPGSGLLQDRQAIAENGMESRLSEIVARHAVDWNIHGNIGLVVGATYPAELSAIRRIAPDMPFLIPGIGAQTGDVIAAVRAGLNQAGIGILVNSSRSISYASDGTDFQEAARAVALRLRDQINAARESVPA